MRWNSDARTDFAQVKYDTWEVPPCKSHDMFLVYKLLTARSMQNNINYGVLLSAQLESLCQQHTYTYNPIYDVLYSQNWYRPQNKSDLLEPQFEVTCPQQGHLRRLQGSDWSNEVEISFHYSWMALSLDPCVIGKPASFSSVLRVLWVESDSGTNCPGGAQERWAARREDEGRRRATGNPKIRFWRKIEEDITFAKFVELCFF